MSTEQCVIGVYCRRHGFIHGAEAEELRSRVERLLSNNQIDSSVDGRELQAILDEVDARDSLAWLEMARV